MTAPDPQADNYGHPYAIPLHNPEQRAEAQATADRLDRTPDPYLEPERDSADSNAYQARVEAGPEPEAGP